MSYARRPKSMRHADVPHQQEAEKASGDVDGSGFSSLTWALFEGLRSPSAMDVFECRRQDRPCQVWVDEHERQRQGQSVRYRGSTSPMVKEECLRLGLGSGLLDPACHHLAPYSSPPYIWPHPLSIGIATSESVDLLSLGRLLGKRDGSSRSTDAGLLVLFQFTCPG